MNAEDQRAWNDELQRLLTQEQVDSLNKGTRILFRNPIGTGPALEVVGGGKGDLNKIKKPQPCAFLDTPNNDWLYNVGLTDGCQQVCVYLGSGKK